MWANLRVRLAPWNRFKASSKLWYFNWPFQDGTSFVDHSCYFCPVLCASVYWCLVVTCWDRAGLLVFVFDVFLWVCYFPISILGQVWYFIVSIPDLCLLSYCHIFTCCEILHPTFCRVWSGSILFAKYTYDKQNWYLKVATILFETLLEHTLATNITHNRISCFKRRK